MLMPETFYDFIVSNAVPLLATFGLTIFILGAGAITYIVFDNKLDIEERVGRLNPFWKKNVSIVIPLCIVSIGLFLSFTGAVGVRSSLILAFLSSLYFVFFLSSRGDIFTDPLIKLMIPFMLTALMMDGAYKFVSGNTLRFNLTGSQPKGIYTLQPADDAPLRGDLVTFCLGPDNPFTALAKERGYVGGGSCPSGMKPLLKRLAGLPGDELEIAPDGIILNGSFLHLSFRPESDSLGREMPPSLLQNGKIPETMALVLSQEHGNSFDSRHFGLVPLDSLTRVEPVLTFEAEGE